MQSSGNCTLAVRRRTITCLITCGKLGKSDVLWHRYCSTPNSQLINGWDDCVQTKTGWSSQKYFQPLIFLLTILSESCPGFFAPKDAAVCRSIKMGWQKPAIFLLGYNYLLFYCRIWIVGSPGAGNRTHHQGQGMGTVAPGLGPGKRPASKCIIRRIVLGRRRRRFFAKTFRFRPLLLLNYWTE